MMSRIFIKFNYAVKWCARISYIWSILLKTGAARKISDKITNSWKERAIRTLFRHWIKMRHMQHLEAADRTATCHVNMT